jgi:hypothetical protein
VRPLDVFVKTTHSNTEEMNDMRFMVLVKVGPGGESRQIPDKEAFAAMGRFNLELANAGMLLGMDGLQASSKGARISFSGGKTAVTDGPFTETKELVAGYWIIRAESKEDAIAWMSRAPFEDGELEIRQVFERSDFPAEVVDPKRRSELDALMDRANAELKA